jgi:Mg-chelatase subunit ChlD
MDYLITKINTIIPNDTTNIELALSSATEQISKYKETNIDHQVIHIFLTDGEITSGSNNYELLQFQTNRKS